MKNFHYPLGISLICLSLSSCNPAVKHEHWNRADESGNQIEVTIVEFEKSPGEHSVTATNINRTWVGHMSGGKERIPERKEHLQGFAHAEVEAYCGKEGFELIDEPSFGMQDESAGAYGGGLLGLALSDIFTSNDNIPVNYQQSFKCNNQKSLLPKA